MRKYETLLLFSPELTAENRGQILEALQGVLARQESQVLTVDDWGMRELAFPVRKQMRGHYVRLEYAAPAAAIAELERNIRITDGIWKFITVQLDENFEPQQAEA